MARVPLQSGSGRQGVEGGGIAARSRLELGVERQLLRVDGVSLLVTWYQAFSVRKCQRKNRCFLYTEMESDKFLFGYDYRPVGLLKPVALILSAVGSTFPLSYLHQNESNGADLLECVNLI